LSLYTPGRNAVKEEIQLSKQYLRVFSNIAVAISVAMFWPAMVGWCQNPPQEKSPTPPGEQKDNCTMKTLKIQWQRLLIDDATCPRCGATEQEVDKAFKSLKQSLNPLGIEVILDKKVLDPAVFKKNPSQSNLIIIGTRTLEDWLKAHTGQSLCCGPCGDTECRTIETQGKIYETIPAELIIKAGLMAAGELLNPKGGQSCCP
jgi:hypothetical protein